MRFIDDDQIEMPGAKAPLAVAGFVDQSHHGGIGGNKNPALRSLRHQITGEVFGRKFLKAFTAWRTNAIRSAKNRTRLAQLQRIRNRKAR